MKSGSFSGLHSEIGLYYGACGPSERYQLELALAAKEAPCREVLEPEQLRRNERFRKPTYNT